MVSVFVLGWGEGRFEKSSTNCFRLIAIPAVPEGSGGIKE